jgi:hypothetical protein
VAKAANFDDVKRPDKVTPSATARPIIVSNHPMIVKDPMMAPKADVAVEPKADEVSVGTAVMKHERTVIPLTSIAKEAGNTKTGETSEAPSGTEPELKPVEAKPPAENATTPEPSGARPGSELPATEPREISDASRDPDAEISAEEVAAAEAKAKRSQDLEDIIASGKYVVPVDAVQRRRSRIATAFLVVLTVALAVVLLDVIVDVGIVHVPSAVPHTHLFSKS